MERRANGTVDLDLFARTLIWSRSNLSPQVQLASALSEQ